MKDGKPLSRWTALVAALLLLNASIGGYLRLRPDRDFVMILIGDHQPAAAVSGKDAPWTVPVHVIASRPRSSID